MRIQTFEDDWLLRLYRPVRELPADVVGTVLFVLLAAPVVLVPEAFPRPLRFLVGVPLLFFVPGYALVAALFPARDPGQSGWFASDSTNPGWLDRTDAISGGERAALAFGLSVAILVLLALVLGATPLGLERTPLVAALGLVVVAGGAVATYRRRQLPDGAAYRVPYREWLDRARAATVGGDSTVDRLVNGFLLVSVVLAASAVVYALAVPPAGGATYTEFYLVTENETTGELVAGEYPADLARGEAASLTFGVENYEGAATDYAVVVQIQRVRTDGTEATVLERHELARFDRRVEPGEVWTETHAIRPSIVGEDLRLTYLLYRGEPPGRPTIGNADEYLFVWIDVSRPEA